MATADVLLRSRKFRVERCVVDAAADADTVDIVRHPGAAVILPLLDDGRVVMIRNYRYAVGCELLELPAGTLDPPESPEACARRELAEETGYAAGRISPLLSFFATPGICDERLHAFVATELTAGTVQHEATERITVCPMEYDEVLSAIADGAIQDAKTIVTLLYHERYAQR